MLSQLSSMSDAPSQLTRELHSVAVSFRGSWCYCNRWMRLF